jgi:nanoRNase/pAp phosphatase (c-di-AMP/oligoRNAs hydrolase)
MNLASVIGQKMSGMGGGHATAAGANITGDVREALRFSMMVVQEFLARKSSNSNTLTNSYA